VAGPKAEVRMQKHALSEPRRRARFLDSSDSLEMTDLRGESNGSETRSVRPQGRRRKA
jgi:hypothetical protein